MSAKEITQVLPEKKLRFRSTANIHYHNENKVEDILRNSDLRDDCGPTRETEEMNKKKG
jgi:hypothetical protein